MLGTAALLAFLNAGVCMFLALWPLWPDLPPREWVYSYDVSSSSLDIAVLAISYALLVAVLLHGSAAVKPRLGQEQLQRRHKSLAVALTAASWLASLLLLAKAVVVALQASDRLWPNDRGSVGLIFMCAGAAHSPSMDAHPNACARIDLAAASVLDPAPVQQAFGPTVKPAPTQSTL